MTWIYDIRAPHSRNTYTLLDAVWKLYMRTLRSERPRIHTHTQRHNAHYNIDFDKALPLSLYLQNNNKT